MTIERKTTEELLVRARDAAEEASRAKGEFLATMSHEIRTPMNGVIGFTNLLLDTPLSEEQQMFASTIRNSGEALLAIINDILDYSKVESGKMTIESVPYDLVTAVEEVVDLLAPKAAEKNLRLALRCDSALARRWLGDPGRVRQVLLNLVGNALKFTDHGGVTVEVGLQPGTSGERLMFRVTDTGIGIPKDKVGKLFQKFTQADASTTRRFGGTGLGLAISRRLAELMGGEIGVESEPGSGSTFWCALPAIPAAPESPSTAAPVPLNTSTLPKTPPVAAHRVLLAEDNVTNQILARRLLEKLGCAVDIAANGREALAMIQQSTYGAVFMNCHMPEMDGFEATQAIREWEQRQAANQPSRHIPIIALTASAMEEDRNKCINAGMDDYLSKPIVLDKLTKAVDRWLRNDESIAA